MRKNQLLFLTAGVCLILALAICPAHAKSGKSVKWVWGEYESVQKGYTFEWVNWFVGELDKRSNGRFKVDVHWGDMGSNKEMLGLAKAGVADIAIAVPIFYPGKLPLANISFLPFAATPRVGWDNLALRRLHASNDALNKEFDKYNVIYGGHRGTAFYNLMTTKPIRKAADFKGKRVRCGADVGAVLKKFGAIPMTLSSSECYNALQTGLIDTYAHFRDSFWKRKIQEVVKYYIIGLDMGGAACPYVINKKSWDKLPDDLKKIYQEVSDATPPVSQYLAFNPKVVEKQLADFKAAGLEFIQFPKEEREKLIAAADSVWAKWVKRGGGAPAQSVLDDYIRIGKEVMAEYPNGLPPYKP